METQTTITPEIGIDYQILFDRPGCLVVCRITEVREKAVKVDYELEPCHPAFTNGNVTVFNYTTWIPKSVIVSDKYNSLTVKKWFARNWKGGVRIKPYYLENGKKVNV